MAKLTNSKLNFHSLASQKNSQNKSSTSQASKSCPQTVILDSDEDNNKSNDLSFVTDLEGSGDEQEKTDDVSFQINVSPGHGKRNQKSSRSKKKSVTVKHKKQVSFSQIPCCSVLTLSDSEIYCYSAISCP